MTMMPGGCATVQERKFLLRQDSVSPNSPFAFAIRSDPYAIQTPRCAHTPCGSGSDPWLWGCRPQHRSRLDSRVVAAGCGRKPARGVCRRRYGQCLVWRLEAWSSGHLVRFDGERLFLTESRSRSTGLSKRHPTSHAFCAGRCADLLVQCCTALCPERVALFREQ